MRHLIHYNPLRSSRPVARAHTLTAFSSLLFFHWIARRYCLDTRCVDDSVLQCTSENARVRVDFYASYTIDSIINSENLNFTQKINENEFCECELASRSCVAHPKWIYDKPKLEKKYFVQWKSICFGAVENRREIERK